MSQARGDFTDAFSPVQHMSGVRMLESIATAKGWRHMLVDLTQGLEAWRHMLVDLEGLEAHARRPHARLHPGRTPKRG